MKRLMALASVLLVAGSASAAVINWQLNMNVQIGLGNFVPGVDNVVVRGYFNGWSGTNPTLTDPDNNGIYTGSYDQGSFAGPYEYKYVIQHSVTGDEWEWVGNRPYTYTEPTIDLPLEDFNNITSLPGTCDVEITYQVDMGVQIATGAFDPMGDLVVMRGPFNGWSGITHQLTNVGGTVYALTVPFASQAETSPIEHKFVIVADGDNWESSPNRLAYGDCDWADTDSDGYKEGTLAPVFFSDTNWDDLIDHDILVVFDIDASRVSCWFANGGAPTYDGTASYAGVNFISLHGFFNGWPTWNGTISPFYRTVNDGSCHWTGSLLFPMGSAKEQIYKLGLNGFDNEAGFGQDHAMNISLDGGTGVTYVNVVFGSNGTQWDCFTGCVETVGATDQPSAFALSQNVPNPFNPVTTIAFTMDATAPATLSVYDLTGAKVATLVNGLVNVGRNEISFDASQLASGVYVYTLQSEGRLESRKMVLVK